MGRSIEPIQRSRRVLQNLKRIAADLISMKTRPISCILAGTLLLFLTSFSDPANSVSRALASDPKNPYSG